MPALGTPVEQTVNGGVSFSRHVNAKPCAYRELRSFDPLACEAACAADSGCHGVVFDDKGNCSLYASTGSSQAFSPKPGWVTQRKAGQGIAGNAERPRGNVNNARCVQFQHVEAKSLPQSRGAGVFENHEPCAYSLLDFQGSGLIDENYFGAVETKTAIHIDDPQNTHACVAICKGTPGCEGVFVRETDNNMGPSALCHIAKSMSKTRVTQRVHHLAVSQAPRRPSGPRSATCNRLGQVWRHLERDRRGDTCGTGQETNDQVSPANVNRSAGNSVAGPTDRRGTEGGEIAVEVRPGAGAVSAGPGPAMPGAQDPGPSGSRSRGFRGSLGRGRLLFAAAWRGMPGPRRGTGSRLMERTGFRPGLSAILGSRGPKAECHYYEVPGATGCRAVPPPILSSARFWWREWEVISMEQLSHVGNESFETRDPDPGNGTRLGAPDLSFETREPEPGNGTNRGAPGWSPAKPLALPSSGFSRDSRSSRLIVWIEQRADRLGELSRLALLGLLSRRRRPDRVPIESRSEAG